MKLVTQFLVLILTLLCGLQAHAERTTTFYHTDGLGSVVAATDQSGAVLWRKDYAPYGAQIDSTPDSESIAYTGKQHDDVTGLTYFGARYYDPEIGRFLSVDPVGFVESNPTSFNRYAYVNNNPYKYVDPDGEFLNFAAKFVLDVGVNMAFNYVTTGELNVGGALKESAIGILNPAKTVAKLGKLAGAVGDMRKGQKAFNKAPCRLSCFVAGTTVLTERGYAPIETLKEGDLVWAHDPETGETALKPIVRTYVNTKDSVWNLAIEKDGVRYLHQVTGSHPYYVVDTGWVEVAHLQPGAVLLTEGGKKARLESIQDTGEVLTTYNFEVAEINTYYVSAAKVLVHNCGGGGGLESRGYRPEPGERTVQGQVDRAVEQAGGNPTVQRGGQDLFRIRSSGHGSPTATATPQNIRRVTRDGRVFMGKGDDVPAGPREIRELYKAQTGHGTSRVRTRAGR